MTEAALLAAQVRRAIEVQFADALVRIDIGTDMKLVRGVLALLQRCCL